MERSGICSQCSKAGVVFTCNLCGSLVGRECLTGRGVCKNCSRGRA